MKMGKLEFEKTSSPMYGIPRFELRKRGRIIRKLSKA
jgi:hypothetical protein